jgi:hypothetical protein
MKQGADIIKFARCVEGKRILVVISPLAAYHKGNNLLLLVKTLASQPVEKALFLLVDGPKKHSFKLNNKFHNNENQNLAALARQIGDNWLAPQEEGPQGEAHRQALEIIDKNEKFDIVRWGPDLLEKKIGNKTEKAPKIFTLSGALAEDLRKIVHYNHPEPVAQAIITESELSLTRLKKTNCSGLPVPSINVCHSTAIESQIKYTIDDMAGVFTAALLNNAKYIIYPSRQEPINMRLARVVLRDWYGYRNNQLPSWVGYSMSKSGIQKQKALAQNGRKEKRSIFEFEKKLKELRHQVNSQQQQIALLYSTLLSSKIFNRDSQ